MNIRDIIKKIFRRKSYVDHLIERGLKVGENFNIYNSNIDYSHCFLIEIGKDVTITNSVILAHDASTKRALGKSKIGKVVIGDRVFIGWGSTIMPNVKIGNDVIIGAGSVVTRDIPSNSVVAGVPAKVIGKTSEYIIKNKSLMQNSPVYQTNWRNKTAEEIKKIRSDLNTKIGFDD
ncbi:acyltransferase [Bacillus hominis]|uniref:Acetyltransferase n=1 Tax=Bacillus cereus TaxID=1396 RepID=A0A2A7HV98_BACCE|nr:MULTISPECIES: acyltransferase [Bacillus cereus group]MDM5435894.1 acyltransferase [Bacillus hominis]PEC21099.1 acetyltransferase [Bacillus cereus]PFE52949.1 acetyltransferase [Bacillus cereus]